MIKERSLIEKAAAIAVIAHKEQLRKHDDSPYVTHPFMVAMKLARHGATDIVIAAALVHDVLEDTDFSEEALRDELGNEVIDIVKAVSNDDSLSWKEKKKKYIETVRNTTDEAKAIALADKVHNMENFLGSYKEQGTDLWQKFNCGKDNKVWFEEEALKMFKDSFSHPLIAEYEVQVEEMRSLE